MTELSQRELECVSLSGLPFPCPADTALTDHRVIDTSQAAPMVQLPPPGMTSCVTPQGRMFSNVRGRLLFGVEKMAIQNICYPGKQRVLVHESNDLLSNLAGNSFEGRCAAATLMTLQMVSAHVSLAPA